MAPPTEQLDAEALAYEQAVRQDVTAEFAAEVQAAIAVLLTTSAIALATGVVQEALSALVARTLGRINPSMSPRLGIAVATGIELGASQARRVLGEQSGGKAPSFDVGPDLTRVVDDIDGRARARLQGAVQIAQGLGDWRTVSVVTAKAESAVRGAETDAGGAATTALSSGVTAVARTAGAQLIWVPERDACLACLAHAGKVVDPGEFFPAGLTFDPAGSKHPAVRFPPLHPHCRCRIQAFHPRDEAFARGIAREAERSVVRGFSNYASNPRRVRAASALLSRGTTLPKTVVARARRDVKRGEFSGRHNLVLPKLPAGRAGEVPARTVRNVRSSQRRPTP
jgi:hypothetical protein